MKAVSRVLAGGSDAGMTEVRLWPTTKKQSGSPDHMQLFGTNGRTKQIH